MDPCKKTTRKAKTTKKAVATKKAVTRAPKKSAPAKKVTKKTVASQIPAADHLSGLNDAEGKLFEAVKNWLQIQMKKIKKETTEEEPKRAKFPEAEDDEKNQDDQLLHNLYDHMKKSIEAEQLRMAKCHQIELELKASLTFSMVASYMSLCKLNGFAKFFQRLAETGMNLILLLGTGITNLKLNSVTPPDLTKWKNIVDGINSAFYAERASIKGFNILLPLLDRTNQDDAIQSKKNDMVKEFEFLMDKFKGAAQADDFFQIDKQLLNHHQKQSSND
jgi:ferritin